MADLKIKTQSLPERCEICHKMDLFDPIANFCQRCNNITKPSKSQKLINNLVNHPQLRNVNNWKILLTFVISGAISGLIFDRLINIEDFEAFWFYRLVETFMPTWKYYFFAGLFFQFAVWASYALSCSRKWFSTDITSKAIYRWVTAAFIQIGFTLVSLLLKGDVMFYIFIPASFVVVIIMALWFLTYEIFDQKHFNMAIAGSFFSYVAFILLVWLEIKLQINVYYSGLGAFFVGLFGFGLITISNFRLELANTFSTTNQEKINHNKIRITTNN